MCWNIHGMNGHGRKQKGEKEKKMMGQTALEMDPFVSTKHGYMTLQIVISNYSS